MTLCSFIKNMQCDCCPFFRMGDCDFESKEEMIQDLEYIRESAEYALEQLQKS